MKFEITKNTDGTTSFSGSFSERDLVILTLDRFDQALIADGARNDEFFSADCLLVLELIYRRAAEQNGRNGGSDGNA